MLHTQILSRAQKKSLHTSPDHTISLASHDAKLVQFAPKTHLGKTAHTLALALASVRLSVASTTAYVYGITEDASVPTVTFSAPPPGTSISVQSLQSDYDNFSKQMKDLQKQTGLWISTTASEQSLSIYSQLTSVPETIVDIDQIVKAKIKVLSALSPGVELYKETMSELKDDITKDLEPVQNLVSEIQALSSSIETTAELIETSTTTGVLQQLQDAYASEISALKTDTDQLNQNISDNNSEISTLKIEAAAAGTVTAVGAVNWWNPVGWVAIAAGGISLDKILSKIDNLEAKNAKYSGDISSNKIWKDKDSAAAGVICVFSGQVKSLATMTSAAQEELTQLANVYNSFADEIEAALTDLGANELNDALNEWNTVIQDATNLELLTLYVWPGPKKLRKPATFYSYDQTLYWVQDSGAIIYCTIGDKAWTAMSKDALSICRTQGDVYAIDGAPVANPQPPHPKISSYTVEKHNASAGWATLAALPVAQIAAGNNTLYAIAQSDTEPKIVQYLDNGSWNYLPQIATDDIPKQIAVVNGQLFALTNNTGWLYQYNNGSWQRLSTTNFFSMTANGNFLGLVDDNNNAYCYNGSVTQSYTDALKVAQMTNGDQYIIDSQQNLYFVSHTSYGTGTLVIDGIIDVCSSETDTLFYASQSGDTIYYKIAPPSLSAGENTQAMALPKVT